MFSRKFLYRISLTFLTAGASLILGLLSFGGMYELFPILSVATAAFVLSVAYEGEIYLQNIKGALKKLLRVDYQEVQLAREFLLKRAVKALEDPTSCPQFLKDYLKTLEDLEHLSHHGKSKDIKLLKKRLKMMEHWFAQVLFETEKTTVQTAYRAEMKAWAHHDKKTLKAFQDKLNQRQKYLLGSKIFSVISSVMMTLGTVYLLMDTFAVVPFLASLSVSVWPILIPPMAMIAGLAYGLLTFNALQDMIERETLSYWITKIRNDLRQNFGARSILMTITATILAGLALALTFCTAGTWWTVGQSAQALFSWMKKIPAMVMGVVNPLVTGISAVIFNLQNTSETLEMVDEVVRHPNHFWMQFKQWMKQALSFSPEENWAQRLNPFRLILKLALLPARIILFIGHLISIGVTADRVPGVSKNASALLGVVSEGFEDVHYFTGHLHAHEHEHHHGAAHAKSLLKERLSHGHSHSHDVDLPTRFLKWVLLPLEIISALWDSLASRLHAKTDAQLSFHQAWQKQQGEVDSCEHGHHHHHAEFGPATHRTPDSHWRIEQAIFKLQEYQRHHLNTVVWEQGVAHEKSRVVKQLIQTLSTPSATEPTLQIKQAIASPSVNQHRWFNHGKTRTHQMLEDIAVSLKI